MSCCLGGKATLKHHGDLGAPGRLGITLKNYDLMPLVF
jgi:hypothetical protein